MSARFGTCEMASAVGITFGVTVMVMNVLLAPGGQIVPDSNKHPFDSSEFDPSAYDGDGVTALNLRGLPAVDLGVEVQNTQSETGRTGDNAGSSDGEVTTTTVATPNIEPLNKPDLHVEAIGRLPFVSIITLSNGQSFLDRNTMLNALYQSYPHSRLELLVVETNSRGPSPVLLEWNTSLANEKYRVEHNYPYFRYWFFPTSGSLATGGKRNFLLGQARGDIIIHLDNDDIGMSNYVKTIVKIFTSSVNAKDVRLPKNLTTKCCRDGSDGPMLRDMVNQAAYSRGFFNPDGSTEFTAETGGGKIGALTSYTAKVAEKCRFGNTQVMEEHAFFACSGAHFGIKECKREDMPGESDQQLLRFIHPLSVTSMGWYVDRVRWNQLTGVDLDRLYKSISGWYEWLHELSRPIEIPRLPAKPSRFYDGRNSPFWADFHKSHSKLLVGGEYPYCEGYVATPGQMWPKPPAVPDQIVAASDARDCCNKCKSLPSDKSCNAFTFNNTAAKGCAMMISDSGNLPDLTFKGNLEGAPYFYEFESAVLLKTCHKCGGAGGFKIPK